MSEINQQVNDKFSKTTDKLLWEIVQFINGVASSGCNPCAILDDIYNHIKVIDGQLQLDQNYLLQQILDSLNRTAPSFMHTAPITYTYNDTWSWYIKINGGVWISLGLIGLTMTIPANCTLLADRIKTILGHTALVYVQYPAINQLQVFVHNAFYNITTIELKFALNDIDAGLNFDIPIITGTWY